MTTKFIALLFVFLFFISTHLCSQKLTAGFSKNEFSEMLKIAARQIDTPWINVRLPAPVRFKMVYRSPVVGLENRWELWTSADSVAVISIRGTTASAASWLENFYCAMVPATGSLHLNDSLKFDYKLAESVKASVHIGWLTAVGFLSADIKEKINHYYKSGYKDFVITGHSQGGGIAYLMRSYLEYQKPLHTIPDDITFKTYCSAAPKPGNLYYSYDFDYLTRNGWGYNIVNESDWVPETPFSIQMLGDFNHVNPLTDAKKLFKKQKLFVRLYLNHVYNKMNRDTRKANRTFKKVLGKKAYLVVKKNLRQLQEPAYAQSLNYQRAGSPVVLRGDADYYKLYSDSSKNFFIHHMPDPYYFLMMHSDFEK